MSMAPNSQETQLLGLQEVFQAATEEASNAMGRWTGGQIRLTLDCVQELPLEEVSQQFGLGTEMVTMVVLTLDGAEGGTLILTFDEENGRGLAASLLKQAVSAERDWTELERSALQETGNILGCAYFNAVARLIGSKFVPSPPTFLQDYGVCVLQQALMEQALEATDVLICQTTFLRGTERLNWNVLFVPNPGLRETLRSVC